MAGKNGIRRVVVGHKPTGDCPAVLSPTYTGIEMVSADTSYSDVKATDNRGLAVPLVELVGTSEVDNRLEISGDLSDGVEYHNIFYRLHEETNKEETIRQGPARGGIDTTVGDVHLGKRLENGFWVKAATTQHYRLCRGKGRMVEYESVSLTELRLAAGTTTNTP
eukprot:scaffold282300_cov86-Attheya_sp.AAC.1